MHPEQSVTYSIRAKLERRYGGGVQRNFRMERSTPYTRTLAYRPRPAGNNRRCLLRGTGGDAPAGADGRRSCNNNRHRHSNGPAYPDRYAGANGNTRPNGNTRADSHARANGNTRPNGNTRANGYAHPNTHAGAAGRHPRSRGPGPCHAFVRAGE